MTQGGSGGPGRSHEGETSPWLPRENDERTAGRGVPWRWGTAAALSAILAVAGTGATPTSTAGDGRLHDAESRAAEVPSGRPPSSAPRSGWSPPIVVPLPGDQVSATIRITPWPLDGHPDGTLRVRLSDGTGRHVSPAGLSVALDRGRGTAPEPLPLAPSAGGFVAGALGSLADGAALRLEMPLPGDARLVPRRVRSAPVPLDGGEPASAGTGWVSAR